MINKPKEVSQEEVADAISEGTLRYVHRWYEVDSKTASAVNRFATPPWGGPGGITQITAAGGRFFIEVYEPE